MFKRKYILISIGLIVLSVMAIYNYMYKNHRDIATEVPDFSMELKVLSAEFLKDIEKAMAKYIDKTIQVSGKVTEIESNNFTLDEFVVCYTDSVTMLEAKVNSSLHVKGRSIGYDELLGLVKLDQVSIIHH